MGSETSLVEAERDIEATRRRLQEKADLLERRLKPEALLRPVRRRLEGTLGAGGGKILDAFREHPLPLALTGLGLGWLMLRDLRAPAGEVAAKAKETASDWLSATLEERPLLLAVGALAAGLAAAFAVPLTREDETRPERGDDVVSAT